MKLRYWALFLLFGIANAETLFVTNGATSKILPCIYLIDVAGVVVETTVDFDTTNLNIVFQADDASETTFAYTAGNIDNVTTPGTWENPAASAVALDVDAKGCIYLHVRDEVLAISGADHLQLLIEDNGTLMMDRILTIYQSLATEADVSSLIDERLAAYGSGGVADQGNVNANEDKIDIIDTVVDGNASTLSTLPTATEFWNEVIETAGATYTGRCILAAMLAQIGGVLSTSGGISTYKDPGGTATRLVGTVSSPGNRGTITITCP